MQPNRHHRLCVLSFHGPGTMIPLSSMMAGEASAEVNLQPVSEQTPGERVQSVLYF